MVGTRQVDGVRGLVYMVCGSYSSNQVLEECRVLS